MGFFNFKKVVHLFSRGKTNNFTGAGEIFLLDLGTSSIKYLTENGNVGMFISSVRRIYNSSEIFNQPNIIRVSKNGGKAMWYAIGESRTSVSTTQRKIDKPDLDILMVYALVKAKVKNNNVNLATMLPYQQLDDKDILKSMLSNKYEILTTNNETLNFDVNCVCVKPEGFLSNFYMQDSRKENEIIICCNFGASTCDLSTSTPNGYEVPLTINIGSNLIFTYMRHTHYSPYPSILNWKMLNGETFSNKEWKENLISIEPIIDGLIQGIKSVLMYQPTNTKVVLCGGTNLMFGKLLQEKLNLKNCVLLKGDEALYTELYGLRKILKSDCSIETNFIETDFSEEKINKDTNSFKKETIDNTIKNTDDNTINNYYEQAFTNTENTINNKKNIKPSPIKTKYIETKTEINELKNKKEEKQKAFDSLYNQSLGRIKDIEHGTRLTLEDFGLLNQDRYISEKIKKRLKAEGHIYSQGSNFFKNQVS